MRTATYSIGCQFRGDRSIAHWMSGLLALTILIFSASAFAQTREDKMLVSYGGVGGYQLPLWFGAEMRIFDRYGVQARPVFIPSAANSMKALLSGDTQATQTSGSAGISQPVLAISGDEDPIVRPSAGRKIAEKVQNGRFVLVHRLGHLFSPPLWPVLVSEIERHAI